MSDPGNLRRAADVLADMAVMARALQALADQCFLRVEFYGSFERFDCTAQQGDPSAIRDAVQALYRSRYEYLRAEAAKVAVVVNDYPKHIDGERS